MKQCPDQDALAAIYEHELTATSEAAAVLRLPATVRSSNSATSQLSRDD